MSGKLDWGPGYSLSELESAQAKWNLRFPPDLLELLLDRRPILPGAGSAMDWVGTDDAIIEARLAWPFEGFWFDVEHNGLWWPEWGERPEDAEGRRALLQAAFSAAPKLVPILGHRYLPSAPLERGNPVFSVYQSDVIFYGFDLADYLERKANGWGSKTWPEKIKRIPFWTTAVERNG